MGINESHFLFLGMQLFMDTVFPNNLQVGSLV